MTFMKRNKGVINRVVRKRLAKTKRIIHGSRAQQVQLPRVLSREPTDWDVFAINPRRAAIGMERALDKKFRGDFFGIKKGATERLRVNKVFNKVTGQTIVDFSLPDRQVPTKAIRGKRFATLKDQKERALENIKNPEKIFRLGKDLDFLRRVREFEKMRGRKL